MNNDINPNDVLLGRGGHTFRHIGNRKFRDLARSLAKKYANSTKLEKSQISRDMVNSLKDVDPPGRFLKKVSIHEWEEVPNVIAREKASQCLRDAVLELVTNTEISNEDTTTGKEKPASSYLEAASSESREKSSCLAASTTAKVSHDASEKTGCNICSLQRGYQMNEQMNSQQQLRHITQDIDGLFKYGMEPSFTTRQSNNHAYYNGGFCTTRGDVYEPHSSNQNRQIFRDASPQNKSNFDSQSMRHNPHISRHQFPKEIVYKTEQNPHRFFDDTQTPCHSLDQQTKERASADEIEFDNDHNAHLDRRSYYDFFDRIDADIGRMSSSHSCVSPTRKKSKNQMISFDDFDLLHCHSTSHSVDSIDSFAKSL